MKRTFPCGHTGKGQFCHTCELAAKLKDAQRIERDEKRASKRSAAECDMIDLSVAAHLENVQREARELLALVSAGTHPYALKGKTLTRSAGKLISVPVGRSYRLIFEAQSLRPIRFVSHEDYNNLIDRRVAA